MKTYPYSFSCVNAKRGHVSRTGYPIKMVTVIQNPLPGILCVWHGPRYVLIMRRGGVDSKKVGRITCLESTPKGKKKKKIFLIVGAK